MMKRNKYEKLKKNKKFHKHILLLSIYLSVAQPSTSH